MYEIFRFDISAVTNLYTRSLELKFFLTTLYFLLFLSSYTDFSCIDETIKINAPLNKSLLKNDQLFLIEKNISYKIFDGLQKILNKKLYILFLSKLSIICYQLFGKYCFLIYLLLLNDLDLVLFLRAFPRFIIFNSLTSSSYFFFIFFTLSMCSAIDFFTEIKRIEYCIVYCLVLLTIFKCPRYYQQEILSCNLVYKTMQIP
ncbi:hypothetical protein AGLY_000995 [Aphis glycines]|uniref:Uncharacterized protein n=1 Tax=Aphis glycines TaxID=307491 RepID=A0A6G0UAW1_APHGL|nr:hypothetical protein AGLY_000995 [Aphis glycines]